MEVLIMGGGIGGKPIKLCEQFFWEIIAASVPVEEFMNEKKLSD